MNKDALECFIKVYEKKSVTSAAKDLFISPQGLSKTIKLLELDVEAELFFRGPHGMEATDCGELLYARAKHLCYLMDDIKKEIGIMSGGKSTLNVLVNFSTTPSVPPDILFGFTNMYPQFQMRLREFPDEYPIGRIFQEEFDVGIVLGQQEIDNCEIELIQLCEVVAVVSKKHRLAGKDEISIMELEHEQLVLKSVEKGKEHSLIDKCLEHGFTPHVVHEFSNVATAHILCEESGYLAISVDLVEEFYNNENLKIIRLIEKIPQNIYLVSRKRDIQTRAVSLFLSYIKNYINEKTGHIDVE
ncbi:LysR family transcriptional regulator [Paenibacillus sp. LMG 31459]|uniref:LysR family transcriptional regulator n=1 Tax=Paenibacillus phytohabitans TaxID=2654978 RepID=A0ABX1YSF4_9BACL|nr:LysR family transcriptional regulator [Paenibacillus phytohabitans]NOU82748.1 LysR family transcriptional regulator [Paenibacillus phytohabitans]